MIGIYLFFNTNSIPLIIQLAHIIETHVSFNILSIVLSILIMSLKAIAISISTKQSAYLKLKLKLYSVLVTSAGIYIDIHYIFCPVIATCVCISGG